MPNVILTPELTITPLSVTVAFVVQAYTPGPPLNPTIELPSSLTFTLIPEGLLIVPPAVRLLDMVGEHVGQLVCAKIIWVEKIAEK
ncbi:hypothetical protein [Cecembia lonarensis]|uniref:hypothetical protein n=1 Tax=Cecembia lonarensis TaxID=645110 RepID=UPI001EE6917E|nr:hypothetical protein [Cecembia lonarensis]